jgi:hypothetical protein
MHSQIYQCKERNKKKTPHSLISIDSGMLQQRPFTMQLKTRSQQPDLKTSFLRTERYGHHLETIQCAGLSTVVPVQMSVNEEEEKLTSGMVLNISELNNKSVLNQVLNPLRNFNKDNQKVKNIKIEPKKHFAEKKQSVTETSKTKEKEEKDEKQNSDSTNKSDNNKATEDKSLNQDPEVTRLLNKQNQNDSTALGNSQAKSQEKNLIAPPPTYDEKKSTPTPKVGTRGQYINKREAMNIIGNNKEFAATQRAVKVPATNTSKKESSKAEDTKQQVKVKNAAEMLRDQVIKEDKQVKEHVQVKLDLDPAIVAKQGGEQLILQKIQEKV